MSLTLRMVGGRHNGLVQKIAFIKRCYLTSLTDPSVRTFAEEAAGRGSRLKQAKALFDVIRAKVNYVPDPVGCEMTKSPSVIVGEIHSRGYAAEDCDGQACLSYTLLKSIGIPAVLRVIWLGDPMPQHIYVVAFIDGREVAFDPTRKSGFGSEVAFKRKEDF